MGVHRHEVSRVSRERNGLHLYSRPSTYSDIVNTICWVLKSKERHPETIKRNGEHLVRLTLSSPKEMVPSCGGERVLSEVCSTRESPLVFLLPISESAIA